MATNTTSEFAVRLRGLRRTYGKGGSAFEAVRGVDLDVRSGTITALLGANGAGKTSTLEMLQGVAEPTEGAVRVLGMDPVASGDSVRQRIGVLPQSSRLSGDLTVRRLLRQHHGTHAAARRSVDEMIERLSLGGLADARVTSLSGGVARRVDLACTLAGSPELVILDEPTAGLDPESRRAVWNLVADLRDAGSTVLFATQHLEEAEVVADRLEIMHAGQIVCSGTPAAIAAGHPSSVSFDRLPHLPGVPDAFATITAITGVLHEGGRTTLETHDLQSSMFGLLLWAGGRDIQLNALDARSPSLETVLLAIADGRDLPSLTAARIDTYGTVDPRVLEESIR